MIFRAATTIVVNLGGFCTEQLSRKGMLECLIVAWFCTSQRPETRYPMCIMIER